MSIHNGKSMLALFLLTIYDKILLAVRKEFFFYKKLIRLESEQIKYAWSVYPSIPLFSAFHLPYFIVCLIAAATVVVKNVVTLFPVVTSNSYFDV